MKSYFQSLLVLSILLFLPVGCAEFQSFQNNKGVQAAESVAFQIGVGLATKSPTYASLAPIAVDGLTAFANKGVTGIDLNGDANQLATAVSQMIPNSTGKTAAIQIANAYVSGVQKSGATGTAPANAVIAAISKGLNNGIASQTTNP